MMRTLRPLLRNRPKSCSGDLRKGHLSSYPNRQSLRSADDDLQATIQEYDKKRPRPRSLKELLAVSSAPLEEVNAFLREEYCIRNAQRVCMFQERLGLERLEAIPELTLAYNLHLECFEAMQNEKDFLPLVRSIVEKGRPMVPLMCRGMARLVQQEEQNGASVFTEARINQFLNEFLLNRIGSNVLMSQYLSIRGDTPTSIVDPQCNVTAICGTAARQVKELCAAETGYRPVIRVESHSSIENDPHQVTASFAFIPSILQYILQELLKNSAVATARTHAKSRCRNDTISVIVCADERRVMIHIGDKGGGIPFEVGQHIWSYLYTTKTARKTHLGGFGVGLPLSRLYASYLGGSINLVSLPGYGTHAYVFLPRLPQNLVEVVPGRANSYDCDSTKSYGEFIL